MGGVGGSRVGGRGHEAVGELYGAEAEEGDGVEGDVRVVLVVGKGDEAVDAVGEDRDVRLCGEKRRARITCGNRDIRGRKGSKNAETWEARMGQTGTTVVPT